MSEEKCLEIKGKMRSMDHNQCPRITVLIRILTPSIVNLFYPQIVNHYISIWRMWKISELNFQTKFPCLKSNRDKSRCRLHIKIRFQKYNVTLVCVLWFQFQPGKQNQKVAFQMSTSYYGVFIFSGDNYLSPLQSLIRL